MAIGSQLKDALHSFAAVEAQIVAHGAPTTAAQSFELVQLRRDLVMEFATLRTAIEAEPSLAASRDRLTQATRLLAAFRTSNAINQADWPVVRVREDANGYNEAVQRVVRASRAFWDWAERTLDVQVRQPDCRRDEAPHALPA